MTTRPLPLFVLGAPDPELARIEALLRAAGAEVHYATVDGRRVHPGNAYAATEATPPLPPRGTRVLVECAPGALSPFAAALAPGLSGATMDYQCPRCGDERCPTPGECDPVVVLPSLDHHRPGDPGYGRPPRDFLAASSLGQVIALLAAHGRAVEWTPDLVFAAAADHCLAAAYAGECPGVDPAALAEWRDATRAAFQRRPVEAVRADREAAEALLASWRCNNCDGAGNVPSCVDESWGPCPFCGGADVADLRAHGDVPELPEAAARRGRAVLYRLPAGHPANKGPRAKIGIVGGGEGTRAGVEPVERFLREAREGWCFGVRVDAESTYGDAVRGYAGCYTVPNVEHGGAS